MNRRIAIFVAVFLAPIWISIAAIAAAPPAQNIQLTGCSAKMLFVTSRKWNGAGYGADRGDGTTHDCGVATCVFNKKDIRWDMDQYFADLAKIGWSREKPDSSTKVTAVMRFASRDEFWNNVRATLAQEKSPEVTVFVHGYDNSFNDAILCSSILESYFKTPVITYSWPTPKTFIPDPFHYHIAEGDVGWAQQPFSDFSNRAN